MKKILITFFAVLFCLTSSIGWSLDYKDLVQRDGLFYKKFTDVPFTGQVTGEEKGLLKNGKKEGSFFKYYKNGQLWSKGNFQNNKKEGSWIVYFNNGQKFSKGKYKNGRPEGYWVMYDEDGTIVDAMTGMWKTDILLVTKTLSNNHNSIRTLPNSN